MKLLIPSLLAFFLIACDDDSSTSANNSDVGESSSKNNDSSAKSSASVGVATSSSNKICQEFEVGSETLEATVGSMTDPRDGQTYKTVTLDKQVCSAEDSKTFRRFTVSTQVWMAQNLNYETANSYCYNDDVTNCSKYGRLYTWGAAIDSLYILRAAGENCGLDRNCSLKGPVRGVCPDGWRLPSEYDWRILFGNVGGKSKASKALKSTFGWTFKGNSMNGTDSFSFSALPAGYRLENGNYVNEGTAARFWSITMSIHNSVYSLNLFYTDEASDLDDSGYMSFAFSVRCIKY